MLSKWFSLLLILSCSLAFAGISFGPEVRIDSHPDPYSTGGTDVINLESGRLVVIWEGDETQPENVRVWSAYSDDYGVNWSIAYPVSDINALSPIFPVLSADSVGIIYSIWQDWRGPEPYAPYFSRSDDAGESWSSPDIRVSDEGEIGLNPSIASNKSGSILVAVFDRLNENRIYSSFSTDGGYTWSSDIPVGDSTTNGQYRPVIENTGSQSFTVIWKDERDTVSFVYCSISEDGGQTWLSPNIPVPCGGYEPLESLDLHWDGSVLHAFWIESYNVMDDFVDEAYYTRSEDGGYTWLDSPVRVDEGSPNTWRRYGGIWARDPANIFAVWCSIWNQSYPIYAVLSVSTDSGKTWSDTLRANPVSGEADRCDITGDVATGHVIVTWDNQINQYIMCATGWDDTGVEESPADTGIRVSRNPFSGMVIFTVTGEVFPGRLSIFDFTGRQVETLVHSGEGQYTWSPAEDTPSGVYFARGLAGDLELSARVVHIR